MSNVTTFKFNDLPVRIVKKDGKPLFVIRDICNILGFSNPNRILAKYTENEPLYERINTPGGPQTVRLVLREDVEKLLGANSGRKALLLERWLRQEVFPKQEEYEEVYSLLAGHLAFMRAIMSVPPEEQPAVFFGIPDFPVQIAGRKGKSHAG